MGFVFVCLVYCSIVLFCDGLLLIGLFYDWLLVVWVWVACLLCYCVVLVIVLPF